MNIAIDTSPLQTGHKVRGVGFYLTHLQHAMETYFPENTYTYFTQKQKLPKDINIVHYPYFDPFFQTIPLVKKNKTIVTIHDLIPLIFPKHFPAGLRGKATWMLQKSLLKSVKAIITDSENSKKDIINLIGLPNERVHVVYLAAGEEFNQVHNEKSKVQSVKEKYKLPEKFALYVGDVTWNKNLPRMVQAIKKLNIPLVMVGKALIQKNFDKTNPWNMDLLEVQQLVADDKRIFRLGFVSTEELVMLYNMATVFIMPSLYEGFGLPVLEAMSCGTPVITTRESSLPEVAGDAAFFVDAYSSENMEQGIQTVFSDVLLRQKLSQKGLEQAKKFSWKNTAEQTIAVYQKILS